MNAMLCTRNLLRSALIASLVLSVSAHAQTFTVLHRFVGKAGGIAPPARVIGDSAGNLYGITQSGGSFNFGTVFKLDPNRQEVVLHSFSAGDGLAPEGSLIWGKNGVRYGTTYDGGMLQGGKCRHGCGTVFSIDKSGKETVVYAFKGGSDGANPGSNLALDPDGNLYGTTFSGGQLSCYVGGCGVIFKIDSSGHQSVLYRFTDHSDGKSPVGLIRDNAGNLYFTTYDGGTSNLGGIFKLDTTGTLSILHSFTGGDDSGDPNGSLAGDPSGNLYGATNGNSQNDFGVIFKIDSKGTYSVLYQFTSASDGEYPNSLVLDKAGNLYGLTYAGGSGTGCYYDGCGTVFKLDPSNNKTILHDFAGPDGQLPNGLILDNAGNLYGTTLGGGNGSGCTYYKGCGTVFKLVP